MPSAKAEFTAAATGRDRAGGEVAAYAGSACRRFEERCACGWVTLAATAAILALTILPHRQLGSVVMPPLE